MSLFKDCMMRNSRKSLLCNYLLDKTSPCLNVQAKTCVVDGGALLHKVKWVPKLTYQQVLASTLILHRKRMIGMTRCAFYLIATQTVHHWKSHEHLWRGQFTSANITISDKMVVTSGSKEFLRNQHYNSSSSYWAYTCANQDSRLLTAKEMQTPWL